MMRFEQAFSAYGCDMFLEFSDRATMQKIFQKAYAVGFSFPNNKQMDAYEAWEYFYYYSRNKNAKPIVHFFYNSIIGKNEMSLTYRAIIKSYPQYKNAKIVPLSSILV